MYGEVCFLRQGIFSFFVLEENIHYCCQSMLKVCLRDNPEDMQKSKSNLLEYTCNRLADQYKIEAMEHCTKWGFLLQKINLLLFNLGAVQSRHDMQCS